jgi:hypothetical protein
MINVFLSLLLAPGEKRQYGLGRNSQNWPKENSQ